MSESESANSGGLWGKWGKYVPAVSLLVAILALLFGSGWVYNQWRKPNLTYQVLPTYELTDQAFSGVIISNSGRSAVTDLELIIADLEAEIIQMETPGSHEPAEVVSGGTPGSTELRLHMDRLSAETSMSVYLLTEGRINIDDSILVTSAEMKGKLGESAREFESGLFPLFSSIGLVAILFLFFWVKDFYGELAIARAKQIAHDIAVDQAKQGAASTKANDDE